MTSTKDTPAKKPIIGLIGGIGSGKSTVAAAFGGLGCVVIDSDKHIREAHQRPEVIATLRSWWGDEVVGADGRLDRSAVAKRVFASPKERERLESYLHPLIATRREDMIRNGLQDPAVKAIILDSPLLLESNLDRLCDSIVFVEAGEECRRQRVAQRGWSSEELARREQWQTPLMQKRSRSDHVIRNEGSIQELHEAVRYTLARILAEFCRKRRPTENGPAPT